MSLTETTEIIKAYRHCREITREHARNFYFAFITLPEQQRAAIYAAYAFCRLCDDITDGPGLSTEDQAEALDSLRYNLREAYDGKPKGPVFAALFNSARSFSIPLRYFDDIVTGVKVDLAKSRYQTFDELRDYCYGVASTVGLVCIQIFGFSDPKAPEYAVDLGIAMQLTNILRDLHEDSQRNRVYLPQDELTEFGYSEQDLWRGVMDDRFRSLMAFQVDRARYFSHRGSMLVPLLPLRSRGCVSVLQGLYWSILNEIEARNYDVFSRRVTLSTPSKVALTFRLWFRSLFSGLLPKL